MPVHSISPGELVNGLPPSDEQARAWCAQLEAGGVLYFPQTPLPIPADDLDFLLSRQQSGSRMHKNIAYKPQRSQLSGVERSGSDAEEFDRLQNIMARYSASVSKYLAGFLAPYRQAWRLDYASYRPIEEAGRDLSLRHRNDLLHTDAFPTRPTRGWRILRFFHNIHPTRTRDWVIGEPFPSIIRYFVERLPSIEGLPDVPGPLDLPRPDSPALRAAKQFARATGLTGLIPMLKRTPYDQFMIELHNVMKEDAEFQQTCKREEIQFAPGSSWMVFTETVPHAVLGGQYALEQTFLVDPAAMVDPASAPVAILESLSTVSVV
jgi:hypothetical protein